MRYAYFVRSRPTSLVIMRLNRNTEMEGDNLYLLFIAAVIFAPLLAAMLGAAGNVWKLSAFVFCLLTTIAALFHSFLTSLIFWLLAWACAAAQIGRRDA